MYLSAIASLVDRKSVSSLKSINHRIMDIKNHVVVFTTNNQIK